MRFLRLALLVAFFVLVTHFASGQQTTTSNTQGSLLLQKSLAALTGAATISDVTLSGSARRIAGSKTVADWQAFRAKLVPRADKGLWQEAARDYFHERLSTRYLEPIRAIQEHGTFEGEGFSIVAIQCTLVEFLESTARGLSYRYIRPGQPLSKYEYSNSSALFVSFLCQRQPFAKEFLTEATCQRFLQERQVRFAP